VRPGSTLEWNRRSVHVLKERVMNRTRNSETRGSIVSGSTARRGRGMPFVGQWPRSCSRRRPPAWTPTPRASRSSAGRGRRCRRGPRRSRGRGRSRLGGNACGPWLVAERVLVPSTHGRRSVRGAYSSHADWERSPRPCSELQTDARKVTVWIKIAARVTLAVLWEARLIDPYAPGPERPTLGVADRPRLDARRL
jgi:hypothetical protein